MLEILSFSDQKRANNRNKHNNFCGENKYKIMKL